MFENSFTASASVESVNNVSTFDLLIFGIGAISLLVVFLGFFALHKIDKMPRTDCCGCSCRRRYLDDILADAEDIKMSPKQKIGPNPGPSRKGTQIGTEIV